MRKPDYDIVVIGGGPAGLAIGHFAPKLGARVAIVEEGQLGGDCTWSGCVPSKALIASARAASAGRNRAALGLPPLPPPARVEIGPVLARIKALQAQIHEESDRPELLVGVDVITGRGRFVSADAIEVDGRRITAATFVIATGARPVVPPIPGLAESGYLTNHSIWEIARLPDRLTVIGGGPIGLELGQAFQRLGSQVTVVEMAPQILPRAEADVAQALRAELEAEGMIIHTRTAATEVQCEGDQHRVMLRGPEGELTAEGDALLVAVGQRPNASDLGLEAAGVRTRDGGGVRVDAQLRTSNKRVYACGDVIGGYQFTHTAAYEASVVMHNALFPLRKQRADYATTPWVVFTDPEVAGVGLTEAEARAKHGEGVHAYERSFRELDRALLDGRCPGFLRIVTVGRRRKIVGAQIVGPSAGELIQEQVLAISRGMNAMELAMTHHAYPTLNEASRWAAVAAVDDMLRSRSVQRVVGVARALNKRPW